MNEEPEGEPRDWRHAGLDAGAFQALAAGLPNAALHSLLIDALARRTEGRRAAEVLRQWRQDRFVQPAPVGPRELLPVEAALFDAAPAFEAIELSPLAPLGSCNAVAPGSARRIVATVRGSEVVSDPTNVMALECAHRLAEAPVREVHLATAHRCTRAQAPPAGRGYAAHFKLFALASGGHERAGHGFVVDSVVEHLRVYLRALRQLQAGGWNVGTQRLVLLAAPGREVVAERVMKALALKEPQAFEALHPATEALQHAYYDGGLRFRIDVGPAAGEPLLPMVDGGVFRWLQRLASQHKLAFVGSAIGTQLLAARLAPAAPLKASASSST